MPKVQKWGNSLALRIPKAFIQALGVKENQEVTISMEESGLLIQPASNKNTDLKSLLNNINPQNIHEETLSDTPIDNEIW